MRITKHSKHNFGRWITGRRGVIVTLIAVKFVTPLFTIESNLSIGGGKPVALRTNSKNSLRHMPPA